MLALHSSTLRWSTISLAGSIAGSLTGIATQSGCFWNKKTAPQPAPDLTTMSWRVQADQPLPTTRREVTPLPHQMIDTPVTNGPLPLVYLAESAGTIRVRNLDTNQLLAASPVSHNSTVAVDARRGVIIDGGVLLPGPLADRARYGIFYSAPMADDQFISATETNNPSVLRWHRSGPTPDGGTLATQSATNPAPAIHP